MSGLLRQRIAIQRAHHAPDGQSGTVVTWPTLTTVWGQLIPVSGLEIEVAQRLAATVTHTWLIRYSSTVADLNAKDRFLWDGRTFELVAVMNTNAIHHELTGTAKELAA